MPRCPRWGGLVATCINIDGLTLVVESDPSARTAALYLWFEVGASDEGPSAFGAAHFLEHMLFKGTPTRGMGQAAATIEGHGGDLNAWTAWDELCVHAVVDANAWEDALEVMVDMAMNPIIDDEEVSKERLVILEEIGAYEDDAESVASDALQLALFGSHPYGRPVLGTRLSVEGLSAKLLTQFRKEHLHPGRATIVVGGPVDPDAVAQAVRREMRGWQPGAARMPAEPLPPTSPPNLKHIKGQFGAATVHIGVRTPALGHNDLAALDVLAACLGQGSASLLPQALELDDGLASGSWASLSTWRQGGALELGFQVGKTEEALSRAIAVLDEVVAYGVDGELVLRSREGILCDMQFATETIDGRAADRVWHQVRHKDPKHGDIARRDIAAVTAADVHRVAAYLAIKHRQVVVVDKEANERKLHAAMAPRTPRRAPTKDIIDLDGMRVVLLPDRGNLAAIRVLGIGGQALEAERVAGLSRAWASTVTRGAGRYDASAFAARTDALAMVLDGIATRSTGGLSATLPADRIRGGLEMVGLAMTDPHFDPADTEMIVDEMLDDEAGLVDQPGTMATDALWRSLFPGHPWRMPPGGTATSIVNIRSQTLARHHRRLIVPENLVVAVAGGFPKGPVLDQLASIRESLKNGSTPVLPTPFRAPVTSRKTRGGQAQAAVVLGARGRVDEPNQRLALQVAAALLDSQAGRLFMSLREVRGLAYSVWASADFPIAQGHGAFLMGLTLEPSRVVEAESALREEWGRLCTLGPTQQELTRTTRMLGGALALQRERVASRAVAIAAATLTGLPYDINTRRAQLDALRPDDILAALGQLLPAQVAIAQP